jgi:hypothetical protein
VVSFNVAAVAADTHSHDKVAAEDQAWQYVAESDGVRPVAKSISLTSDRPQDLLEEVTYLGLRQRYAQLRYGSENSRRVVVVVDERGEGRFDFFIDADRDRTITADEQVAGDGRTRRLELDAEIILEDEPILALRTVELRLGATGTRLSVATIGFIEGSIQWAGQDDAQPARVQARRVDGNANGLFADGRDRLQIDLNDDGDWNAVSEQFSWLPIQTIGGRRYAVRSDRLGSRLALAEITGVGKLQVVAANLPPSAKIISFEAMVFSDDGSAYSVQQPNSPLEVPVGRYTLGSVTLTIDNGDREPWHFVFARSGSVAATDWTSVDTNQDVSLEAIGETRFTLTAGTSDRVRPGDAITISPRMYTQDGLLINLSCRGRRMGSFDSERSHNRCNLKLISADGKTVSSAQSGFA